MSKNKISDWSTTASGNTDIGGININEGCPPSTINNAIRELMAQVRDFQLGADGDGLTVSTLNATTATIGALNVSGTVASIGVTAATITNATIGTLTATTANVQGGLLNNVSISNATVTTSTVNGVTVGSNAAGSRTVATTTPSGGVDGDIWYQY